MSSSFRVCTQNTTKFELTEQDAIKVAAAICESARTEVRVLDDRDDILFTMVPPGQEASR